MILDYRLFFLVPTTPGIFNKSFLAYAVSHQIPLILPLSPLPSAPGFPRLIHSPQLGPYFQDLPTMARFPRFSHVKMQWQIMGPGSVKSILLTAPGAASAGVPSFVSSLLTVSLAVLVDRVISWKMFSACQLHPPPPPKICSAPYLYSSVLTLCCRILKLEGT